MSLRKILVLDGVTAVCRFRDDGVLMEAEGILPQDLMDRLAKFAAWCRAIPISCPCFRKCVAGRHRRAGSCRARG